MFFSSAALIRRLRKHTATLIFIIVVIAALPSLKTNQNPIQESLESNSDRL